MKFIIITLLLLSYLAELSEGKGMRRFYSKTYNQEIFKSKNFQHGKFSNQHSFKSGLGHSRKLPSQVLVKPESFNSTRYFYNLNFIMQPKQIHTRNMNTMTISK